MVRRTDLGIPRSSLRVVLLLAWAPLLMKRPKAAADYHKLAKLRGFQWLGPPVPNTSTSTEWQCPLGHTWMARYANIRSGRGCPVCAGKRIDFQSECESIRRDFGVECTGALPRRVTDKAVWKCPRGHTWSAEFRHIRNGVGCPHCSGQARKTEDDYRQVALRIGVEWIGSLPTNTREKTVWKCPKGHIWRSNYGSASKSSGCPRCSGRVKKTPEDYRSLAKERQLNAAIDRLVQGSELLVLTLDDWGEGPFWGEPD